MRMISNYTQINYQYQKYFIDKMTPVISHLPKIKINKNEHLIGNNKIYYIQEGIIRQYFLDENGKEKSFLF